MRTCQNSCGLGFDAAKTAVPQAELAKGAGKYLLGKIGPEFVDKNKFRIGALPQQEIRNALFATGADEKVGIRNSSSIQIFRYQFRRNI